MGYVRIDFGGRIVRVSRKGLKKALHATHKTGKFLRDLL